MDLMVHCGITDIKYNKLSFGVLPSSERMVEKKKQQQAIAAVGSIAAHAKKSHNISPATVASTPPKSRASVGSVSVHETSGIKETATRDASDHEDGDYPAGIGIWYTKSNVNANELTPSSGVQPVRSQNLIEAYLSPTEDEAGYVDTHTPKKDHSPFNTVVFDTPSPMGADTEEQYYDECEKDTPPKRSSYKPPRKSFTPGPMSSQKHKKVNSMPIISANYEDSRSRDIGFDEDEVVLADDLNSPANSPSAALTAKTPASRKSYQPARKSFTPGPNNVSARKAARENATDPPVGSMSLLFSHSKAPVSPLRVLADPALRRELVDEESFPAHQFNEDMFNR